MEAVRRMAEACQGLVAALQEFELRSREVRSTSAAGQPPAAMGPPERGPQGSGSEAGGAGARQAAGPIRLPQPKASDQTEIGAPIAFDRSSRIDTVRSIESKERVNKTLSFDDPTIESIGAVEENEVRCEAVRFLAERISRALCPKPGRRWRDDRRLIATAAVIALRIDGLSADNQAGQRWVQAALDAVERFEPKNAFGYFTRCLQNGLRELDRSIPDGATAAMIWIRLTRRIPIPEQWLVAPARRAAGGETEKLPALAAGERFTDAARAVLEGAFRKAE